MLINPIVVKNLGVKCIIGIHPWERKNPQNIFLDIKCFLDFTPVFRSQSFKDTVDYVAVSHLAEKLLRENKYKLLETFAHDFSNQIFDRYPCTGIELTIKKPTKDVANARYVGIQLKIGRNSPLHTAFSPDTFAAGSLDFLKGKTILITGAAKGLGRAFAEHFAHHQAKVAVHYFKSKKEAQALVTQLKKATSQCQAYGGELASYADMKKLASAVARDFGQIDFLINNVGAYSAAGLFDISPEEFHHIINTNICGTYYLTREVLPHMRKNGFGRIVNIGQVSAERIRAWLQETPHHMSKTALLTLTKSIAKQEAAAGITCNMVSPGVMTNNTHFPPEFSQQMPMGRLAEFADLIAATNFLLSPQAQYVTGTNIDVAGGYGL